MTKNDACSFISLYSILSSLEFVGPTGTGSEGIAIWYRVDKKGYYAQELKHFTGGSTASLREALGVKNKLTHLEPQLKLVVSTSAEKEVDLDELRNSWTRKGISFSFAKLISDYNISEDNPILVKLPGKQYSFRFN
jgi:hypothetical protein